MTSRVLGSAQDLVKGLSCFSGYLWLSSGFQSTLLIWKVLVDSFLSVLSFVYFLSSYCKWMWVDTLLAGRAWKVTKTGEGSECQCVLY